MNVFLNQDTTKISYDEIPDTYEEFITKTLPENLYPDKLPLSYSLKYLDQANCPIKLKSEKNYQTMLKVMKEMRKMKEIRHDFAVWISPEQIHVIKVEEGADGYPIRNRNHARPNADETHSANASANLQSNEEPAQNNLGGAANDQEADRLKQEASAEVNENPQNNAEPTQINPLSHPIFTHENIEWVLNEPDALRKGLSERIEEIKEGNEKNSKRRSKGNKGPKLKNELRFLKKNESAKRNWEELEDSLEKKIQTSPTAGVGVTPDQNKTFDKGLDALRKKWKKEYHFVTDFERGYLKVMAFQEQITNSRFKPNTSINDETMKVMMRELREAMKSQDFDSQKIKNLFLSFKNCQKLSRNGLSELFQIINSEFQNVWILNLDFSLESPISSPDSTKGEMIIDLQHLDTLNINLTGRWDITREETSKLIESVGRSSDTSLKSFNFFLPNIFYFNPKAIKEIETKFSFVATFPQSKS